MKIKILLFFLVLTLCLSCQQSKSVVTNTQSASTTKSVIADDASQFKVSESFYDMSVSGGNFVKWAAVIENPNEAAYGLFPTVTVTARDENGLVVGTEDQVLRELPPGIRIAWAGQMSVTKPPKTVEITPLKVNEWRSTRTRATDYLTFQTDKVNITPEQYQKNVYKVTGDVSNPYENDIDQLAVVVLLRSEDGKLIGGGTGYVSLLPAKGSRPFSVNFISAKEKPQKTEVFAFPRGSVSWNSIVKIKD
jgi:hypothetical protein